MTQSRHPGTVDSDRQAFDQIAGRVRQEVGGVLARLPVNEMPFWALARALFPVAESVGDLIHRNSSTALNLRLVLENQFEAERSGYRGVAAILTTLYRHSLMHQDELRVIKAGGRRVGWRVGSASNADHLRRHRDPDGITFRIEWQPRVFLDDLLKVCETQAALPWHGHVMQRYNSWMSLDLEAELSKRRNSTYEAAITEIADL